MVIFNFAHKTWEYQRGNQKPQIKESETKHWTKGKDQEDKQRLQSNTQNNTSPMKNTRDNTSAPEGTVHASLVAHYVLYPGIIWYGNRVEKYL